VSESFFFPGFFTSFHIWSVLYRGTEKGWVYPNHKHPLFEILYVERGDMSEWVNGVEYRLKPGDFILINSGDLHYPQAHEDSHYFNFHFDVEPREVHSLFRMLRKPVYSPEQPPAIRREIREWMERLIGLFQEQMDFAQKMLLQANMLQFLALLLEKTVIPSVGSPRAASLSKRQIANETAYLLETRGTEESVQISGLAKRLNVHRNYITNCFKEVYGVSPKYYLTKVKIEKAKKLLQETDLTVQEISETLKFSSAAYFCKFFRSHVGYTPHQYRIGSGKKA